MSFESSLTVACSPGNTNGPCKCGGVCSGYASRTDCPPLIVLAVLASELLPSQENGHTSVTRGGR
jgi:hypothetical protein